MRMLGNNCLWKLHLNLGMKSTGEEGRERLVLAEGNICKGPEAKDTLAEQGVVDDATEEIFQRQIKNLTADHKEYLLSPNASHCRV